MNDAAFDMAGTGTCSMPDGGIALDVDITLTEALSEQAGRDLYRYASGPADRAAGDHRRHVVRSDRIDRCQRGRDAGAEKPAGGQTRSILKRIIR
jgi:hypothetical protein